MSKIENRERYTSVSQRQMVMDNRIFLVEAILDPTKTSSLYESFYPFYKDIVNDQLHERRILRKVIKQSTMLAYMEKIRKNNGYIRTGTREIFQEYLLTLSSNGLVKDETGQFVIWERESVI